MTHSKLLFVALALSWPLPVFSNDGRDRHQGATPTQLQLFPEPIPKASGYRFLEQDAMGGADGTEMFRWVRPIGATLVRLAAFDTYKQLGEAPYPMSIFDLASENGDTPVDFNPGKPPRGRHPGGSHDGGLNLDLGYYLTTLKGKHFTPDFAACTEHFEPSETAAKNGEVNERDQGQDKAEPKHKDVARCLGAADKVSIKHQSLFLLEMAKINRHAFDGDLIEEIGIDWQVRQPVLKQLEEWARTRKFGASRALYEDLAHAFTSDEWDGWASSHHHHIHVRMRDMAMTGAYRKPFNELREREKMMDFQLLSAGNSRSKELWTRLYSQGLSRAMEAELLNTGDGARVRFKSEGVDWQLNDPSRSPRISATWDLPDAFSSEGSGDKVTAEIIGGKGRDGLFSVHQRLPKKPYYLTIAVDPTSIQARVEAAAGSPLKARLEFPQPYLTYITGVNYIVSTEGGEDKTIEAQAPAYELQLPPDQTSKIKQIAAKVRVGSRITLSTPVYNSAGEVAKP